MFGTLANHLLRSCACHLHFTHDLARIIHTIQAKGITPDIEVLQDLPDDIKAKTDTSTEGEASLRGHLQGDAGKEQTGSQSYIPPDQRNDKALIMAEDLLRGVKVNPAFPPNAKNVSIQH